MVIENDNITGFTCKGKASIRCYWSGSMIYKFSKSSDFQFNLPKGIYTSEYDCSRLVKPVKFKRKSLPKPSRNYNLNDATIVIKPTLYKAFTVFPTLIITIDPKFLITPVIYDFILSHELGHFRYEKEKNADMWGYNHMLTLGYNPSQIAKAQLFSLSEQSLPRLKHLFKHALKK